jgi:hypothetical protein
MALRRTYGKKVAPAAPGAGEAGAAPAAASALEEAPLDAAALVDMLVGEEAAASRKRRRAAESSSESEEEGGGEGGAKGGRSAAHAGRGVSAANLRASGRAKATLEELQYYFVRGRSGGRACAGGRAVDRTAGGG